MLNQYLTQTAQLLQNPAASTPLYSPADLTSYINRARGFLAGDAECVRVMAPVAMVVGQRVINFADFDVSGVNSAVRAPFNARFVWFGLGEGQKALRPRPWPWFAQYKLNNPVPPSGQPEVWSQYAQGIIGSLYFDPIPDDAYSLQIDTVCLPIDLVDDSTAEAIPYPWTECVCFRAAYYALLSAQAPARQADADRMMQRYEDFKSQARKMSNPSILPGLYEQAQPTISVANQLGVQAGGGGP